MRLSEFVMHVILLAHLSDVHLMVMFSLAPFATTERKKKRTGDRRHAEVGLALKQVFETVVHTHLYQRSEIDVHVQVLQADGGQ